MLAMPDNPYRISLAEEGGMNTGRTWITYGNKVGRKSKTSYEKNLSHNLAGHLSSSIR
jgi:hypothetical protein